MFLNIMENFTNKRRKQQWEIYYQLSRHRFLDTIKSLKEYPKTCIRYVNDIFVIIDFNIKSFLEHLNCQSSTIKLIFEEEIDGGLLFMDFYKNRCNEKLELEIYRKKTHIY